MHRKRLPWLTVVLALWGAQCVAAVVVHLGTFWWADVSYDALMTGLLVVTGVNVLAALALFGGVAAGALPAPAFRPVWTYFGQMPRGLQLLWLLALLVAVYGIGLALLDWNTKNVFGATGHLALARILSSMWLSISLNGLLAPLYWGWVVPRRAADSEAAGVGHPSRLSS